MLCDLSVRAFVARDFQFQHCDNCNASRPPLAVCSNTTTTQSGGQHLTAPYTCREGASPVQSRHSFTYSTDAHIRTTFWGAVRLDPRAPLTPLALYTLRSVLLDHVSTSAQSFSRMIIANACTRFELTPIQHGSRPVRACTAEHEHLCSQVAHGIDRRKYSCTQSDIFLLNMMSQYGKRSDGLAMCFGFAFAST